MVIFHKKAGISMSNVKISVIIPIYNVEKYLDRCLKSIFSQTFTDYEVICVNDCTPDNSEKIIDSYKAKYPEKLIAIKNEKNMGLGATRDNGMKYATGDYVAFIDSDDCIKPDYLETFYKKITEDDYDMVSGGYIIVREDKKKIIMNEHPDKHSKWLWPSAWAKLYKRSFLLANDLDFRGIRIYEDEPFTYRVMFKKPKVATVDYCGYYYIMNGSSITQSKVGSRVDKFYTYLGTTTALVEEGHKENLNDYEKNIFEFSIMAGLVANALFNGKSSGKDAMKDVHKKCFELMDEHFPSYMKNPFFHLFKLPKLEFKKRYCTWLIIFARRIKLDRFLFKLVGRL